MKEHITSEILRKQATNQFQLVLEVIERARCMIRSGRDWDQVSQSKNVALKAIADAEEGVDFSSYVKVEKKRESAYSYEDSPTKITMKEALEAPKAALSQ